MSGADGSEILVLGGGEIGLGFAVVLADAGHPVGLVEPDAAVRSGLGARRAEMEAEMETAGFARGEGGALTIHAAPEAVPRAELAIEAGPEDVGAKRAIFAGLRARFGPDLPIATTSSAIPVSRIVERPEDQRACLVAHPANPPTLIRVVEVVPAPETDPAVAGAVETLLARAGFRPVRLGREVEGFALNRLQSALLREAYRLVEAGIVDVAGADRLVAEGLGPRWALSGPFETADLNTPGGIRAHAARMGPAYARIGRDNGERGLPWPEALVEDVARQREAALPDAARPARVRWRRRALARLLAAREKAMEEAEAE